MARRKWEAACEVCHVDPAITIHESSQLRCCLTCSALLSEEGGRREPAVGTQLMPIRGIQMESWVTSCWVTSLKVWVLSFTSRLRSLLFAGWKLRSRLGQGK